MSSPATTKERIIEVLRGLPPDATVDDAIERLAFMAWVEEGLAQLEAGDGVLHEEVKRRFGA
jgi:predicted transcriptional regulator